MKNANLINDSVLSLVWGGTGRTEKSSGITDTGIILNHGKPQPGRNEDVFRPGR